MRKIFLILTSILLIFLISTTSATRLPTINGDLDNWGTILNMFLNVSHNESGGLKNIDNTQLGITNIIGNLRVEGLVNFSGTVYINNATDISTLGNLTFNQLLTDSLYANIQWNYNQTLAAFNLYNSTWDNSWVNQFAYNHTLSTYNLWNDIWSSTYNASYESFNTTKNIQELLNSTGIYNQGNSTFNQSFANTLYAPNTTAGIQYLINNTNGYFSTLMTAKVSGKSEVNLSGVLYVNSTSGNVGIGTTTPYGTLAVIGAPSSSYPILRLGDNALTTTNFDFKRSTTTGALSIQGNQIGNNNIILAPTSGNVGIGTTTPSQTLDVRGQGNFSGTIYINNATDLSTAIVSFTNGWNRTVGNVFLNHPNDNVGIGTSNPLARLDVTMPSGAIAILGDNYATGEQSIAMGSGTNASGAISTAMGLNTLASEHYSTAMGSSSSATGDISTAMGSSSSATGDISTSMGYGTNAAGTASTSMGYGTNAAGTASTSMGYYTLASSYASIAMGYQTVASGMQSTAMGSYSRASGHYSTAMGYQTVASGMYSTAMGREIIAGGDYSFAISLNDQNMFNVTQANTLAIIGGNVGIGTASPSNILSIVNPNGSSIIDIDGITTTSEIELKEGGVKKWRIGYDMVNNKFFIRDEANSKTSFEIQDGAPTSTLVLNSSGNVGIGTDTPSQQLQLTGNMLFPNATLNTNGNLFFGGDSSIGQDGLRLFKVAGSNGYIDVKTNTSTDGLAFRVDTTTGGTTRMFIQSGTGNVGIGVSTPTSKLAVVGLPTSSAGLATGDFFTQTATELGGTGTTKVVCVV